MDKIDRYAETGAGDVKVLVGQPGKQLRIGDFRAILEETEMEIIVQAIRPRGEIYD
jgi:mRNA interferase RelE/StbE